MKLSKAILFAGLLPVAIHAGEVAPIESGPAASRWRFGMSFAPIFNVDASFSGLGGFSSPFTPQPLGGAQNYQYDDGFVFVDSGGNGGDTTSFWSYTDASQYNPAGAGSINQHITNSASNGKAGETEDISPAMEFFAYYDMGRIAEISGRSVNWGFKGGLHYASISINNSRSTTSDVLRLTDSFEAGGNIPPGPGYVGPFNGIGFLLGDDPTRTLDVLPGGATITGKRDLDVDMFTFGFGPYIEIPVTEKFSVFAEAGVSLAIAHGDYDFNSTTTIAPLGTQTTRGSESRTVILPGAYAGVSAIWKLSESFAFIGSARYQYLDAFEISASGSKAKLNFDGSAIISIGGLWSF